VAVGFSIANNQYDCKNLGPKSHIGDDYILKNRKAEFYYKAGDEDVEAIGITREYFLKVLDGNPKKKLVMEQQAESDYLKLREELVVITPRSVERGTKSQTQKPQRPRQQPRVRHPRKGMETRRRPQCLHTHRQHRPSQSRRIHQSGHGEAEQRDSGFLPEAR
jgi:hypothetical protein